MILQGAVAMGAVQALGVAAAQAMSFLAIAMSIDERFTIPADAEPPFPGDLEIERRIKSFVRWNAMSMVTRANRDPSAPGGHISTFASSHLAKSRTTADAHRNTSPADTPPSESPSDLPSESPSESLSELLPEPMPLSWMAL